MGGVSFIQKKFSKKSYTQKSDVQKNYPEELSNTKLSKLTPIYIKQMVLHHFLANKRCYK